MCNRRPNNYTPIIRELSFRTFRESYLVHYSKLFLWYSNLHNLVVLPHFQGFHRPIQCLTFVERSTHDIVLLTCSILSKVTYSADKEKARIINIKRAFLICFFHEYFQGRIYLIRVIFLISLKLPACIS